MSNYFDRRYTDAHHDHERDHRKHEPRPTDRDFPDRFAKALSTAEDIAICVRTMKNVADAAALIERYAEHKAGVARDEAVAAGARP